MLRPFLHKIVHDECESLSTIYLRHFKEPDVLFGRVLLKVKSGGFDRIIVVVPLLARNMGPRITDGLLCEGYVNTF